MINKNKQRGFTLIEILIVVALIGIFVSLVGNIISLENNLVNRLTAQQEAQSIANQGYIDLTLDGQSKVEIKGSTPFGTDYKLSRGIRANGHQYSYVEFPDANGNRTVIPESLSRATTSYTDKCILYEGC